MFNTIRLTSEQIETMHTHAREALPDECCGILLGRRVGELLSVEEIRRVCNIAEPDRTCRYELDPRAHLKAQREARQYGGSVIGFYHSHPTGSAEPSLRDLAFAWPEYCYVIFPVDTADGKPIAWRLDEQGSQFIGVRITGNRSRSDEQN